MRAGRLSARGVRTVRVQFMAAATQYAEEMKDEVVAAESAGDDADLGISTDDLDSEDEDALDEEDEEE